MAYSQFLGEALRLNVHQMVKKADECLPSSDNRNASILNTNVLIDTVFGCPPRGRMIAKSLQIIFLLVD